MTETAGFGIPNGRLKQARPAQIIDTDTLVRLEPAGEGNRCAVAPDEGGDTLGNAGDEILDATLTQGVEAWLNRIHDGLS
jgi:hypothetical protein